MNNKTRFQIVVDKHPEGLWSFGICLSHCVDETYIFINIFKLSISIGKLYKKTKCYDDNDDWSKEIG